MDFKTVAELLEDESRWTVKVSAADENGKEVAIESNLACCWCLYGAVRKVYGFGREGDAKLSLLQDITDTGFIATWNDNPFRTHKEVLELVRKAGI